MPKPTKVVIIHGSFGLPEGNWFPWLKAEVEKLEHQAIVPRFPTPNGQNFQSWKSVVDLTVGGLDEQTILIGHSVGAGFILGLLDAPDAVPIKATFFVAGFLGKIGIPEYDLINETFVCRNFDWQRIRRNAAKMFVFSGDNDPYVPAEKSAALSESLLVQPTIICGGGHLNAESGYHDFPQLLEQLLPFL